MGRIYIRELRVGVKAGKVTKVHLFQVSDSYPTSTTFSFVCSMSSALRSERREKMIMPGYRFHLPRCMKDIDEPNTIPVDLWRGLIQDSSAHGFQNLGRAKGTNV